MIKSALLLALTILVLSSNDSYAVTDINDEWSMNIISGPAGV